MQSEKLTCVNKLQELLIAFTGLGVEVIVHSVKETACSTPQIESVEFRQGNEFVVLKATYGLTVLVPPTPKMVKKTRVTGELAGVEGITKVFDRDDYSIKEFAASLTCPKIEEFEELEA